MLMEEIEWEPAWGYITTVKQNSCLCKGKDLGYLDYDGKDFKNWCESLEMHWLKDIQNKKH